MRRMFQLVLLLLAVTCSTRYVRADDRPNILWITSEDNGPHLGCYGDTFAHTPHLDRLAERGMIYLNAWSTAPVCAPARTTLISGVYPPSTGSQHMRSMTRLPKGFMMYPQYLRAAGYYCTNNSKEDYNLEKPGQVWDESSKKAHWKNREPGQPFFAVFNHTVSHESQIRRRPHQPVHDPDNVRVPAYHPDTPEVRQDWAQYYDKLTEMDALVGQNLRELQQAGLAEDTIVFYYGDHGSGMPRNKRWTYNSGLRVPLIVYVPERFRHLASSDYRADGKTGRLVGFIDLAPTLLSLVGLKPPAHFQGHAFMGPHAASEPTYIHGFRGRMDERYDMVRVVRDKRYIYIRNYMPHKIYGQFISYMFQTPTTRVWKELFDRGDLNDAQSRFWRTKPPEELYDLSADPDEIVNLAGSPMHQAIVTRMRGAQQQWAKEIRDLGFLPENEIHARSVGSTPYEMGHDDSQYPLRRIMEMAELASSLDPDTIPRLVDGLDDEDSAVRYWACLGFLMRGPNTIRIEQAVLRPLLDDSAPSVRVIAAHALASSVEGEQRTRAISLLLESARLDASGVYISMLALNALDELDELVQPWKQDVEVLPRRHASVHPRMRAYVSNLIDKTTADF